MADLLTYATYSTDEEASELTDLLESNGIVYKVEHNKTLLDKIYIGDNYDPLIAVKVPANEFEQVNQILRTEAGKQIDRIDRSYYLFQFSDQELVEVVRNKLEWNPFDQGLAEKILAERKVQYSIPADHPDVPAYTPTRLEGIYLVLEYLLAVAMPYAGILIGMATMIAYKTLPDGTRVKMYDEQTRKHGKIILVLGIARTLYTLYFFAPLWLKLY